MLRFGVDEAGKGPVFGSMFAAAVCVDDPARLPEGIADSKRLTPSRREELAAQLSEDDRIHVGIAEITTATIDDPETNMNTLAVTAHATAIRDALEEVRRTLESGEGPLEGLCDACDTDADRFARRVAEACDVETALGFDVDYRIDAHHGADDEYPIVGAASIVAKVERDAHVAAISETYGDVGSGYPSDPKTRAFLEAYVDEHRELPPFARASWSTCADVLAASEQTGLGEF